MHLLSVVLALVDAWTITKPHLNMPRCYAKSSTSQDGFQPIPGLSCAVITERWGLVSECSQVAGCILNVRSVEAFRKHIPSCSWWWNSHCSFSTARSHNIKVWTVMHFFLSLILHSTHLSISKHVLDMDANPFAYHTMWLAYLYIRFMLAFAIQEKSWSFKCSLKVWRCHRHLARTQCKWSGTHSP